MPASIFDLATGRRGGIMMAGLEPSRRFRSWGGESCFYVRRPSRRRDGYLDKIRVLLEGRKRKAFWEDVNSIFCNVVEPSMLSVETVFPGWLSPHIGVCRLYHREYY